MRIKPLFTMLSLAAVLSLTLAACGGGSSSSSSSSGSASDKREAAQLKFSACMRKQGVNVPDPGSGGPTGPPAGVDQSKLQTAAKSCQKYLQGAFGNLTTADRQKFQDQLTKFTACLRSKGLNVADPSPSSGPGGGPIQLLKGLDRSNPNTQAAMTACQKQVGLQPPGGGAGGPGGPPGGAAPSGTSQ